MIGLGTAAIGRPHYINIKKDSTQPFTDVERFKKDGKAILENAYNMGVRHFDTAPGYGIAEQIILEWLEESPKTDLKISTKWGYEYVANFDPNAQMHELKDLSLKQLEKQWLQSQKFLPQLKIYQIHSATIESGVFDDEEVIAKLYELKSKHQLQIGFSSSGADQNDTILKALDVGFNGERLFSSVQVTYNVLDQSFKSVLTELRQHNFYIIIKEALANGRLFPNENYSNYNKLYRVLERLSDQYQTGIDAIALRYVLDSIQPDLVLSGASNFEHLKSNLEVNRFSLSPDEIAELEQFQVNPNAYWHERSLLQWN